MYKIILIVWIALFANAQNNLLEGVLKEANNLYYMKNEEKSSFSLYQLAAKNGSPEAKAQLIKMYYYGIGVKKDRQKAKELFDQGVMEDLKNSAKNNNAFAQYLYAYFLDKGIFIAKNKKEAKKWYRKASRRKFSTAMNNLALIYSNERACHIALKLLQKAQKLNDPVALYNLGYWHESGNCVDIDLKKAEYYYELSSKLNYNTAKKRLEKLRKRAESDKKAELLKEKILNTKLYKNNCTMPIVPSYPATRDELKRAQREKKRFYRCLNGIFDKNDKIISNLVKEAGGYVEKQYGGSLSYRYPSKYDSEFRKLFKRNEAIKQDVMKSSSEYSKMVDRYNKKARGY